MSILIIIFLASGSVILFWSLQSSNDTHTLINEICSSLRKQQSLAMLGYGASAYGVHFEDSRYVEFVGDTYIQDSPTNKVFLVPAGVSLVSISFGGTSDTVFSRLTGDIVNTGSFLVDAVGTDSDFTLSITKHGAITIQ